MLWKLGRLSFPSFVLLAIVATTATRSHAQTGAAVDDSAVASAVQRLAQAEADLRATCRSREVLFESLRSQLAELSEFNRQPVEVSDYIQLVKRATISDEARIQCLEAYRVYLRTIEAIEQEDRRPLLTSLEETREGVRVNDPDAVRRRCDAIVAWLRMNDKFRSAEMSLFDATRAVMSNDGDLELVSTAQFALDSIANESSPSDLPVASVNLLPFLRKRLPDQLPDSTRVAGRALIQEYQQRASRLFKKREKAVLRARCDARQLLARGESDASVLRAARMPVSKAENAILELSRETTERVAELLDDQRRKDLLGDFDALVFPPVYPDPTSQQKFLASVTSALEARLGTSITDAHAIKELRRAEINDRMERAYLKWCRDLTVDRGRSDLWDAYLTEVTRLGNERLDIALSFVELARGHLLGAADAASLVAACEEEHGRLLKTARLIPYQRNRVVVELRPAATAGGKP